MTLPLSSRYASALRGTIAVPGDKSISHRALMLGGMALGETTIDGLLEGEDVLRTAQAMRMLGADVQREVRSDGSVVWRLWGRGVGGLKEPDDVLDMGNAGTGARLLMGILATSPFVAFLTGDASLRTRPMRRVITPLEQFGARFVSRDGARLPLAVIGTEQAIPLCYTLPVASAQVKSAILLAGLNTLGDTVVIEPVATRDHTETMLAHFGAPIVSEPSEGGRKIVLNGPVELTGQAIVVPGDPSSAAFPLVAALIVPDSEVRINNICVNPLRSGLFATLREMGADIVFENERRQGGEAVADLIARFSPLRGVTVPAERAPSMIDEYPVLAMAAACANGPTRMDGLGELRVKESDRLGAVTSGLRACGVEAEIDGDSLIVRGRGYPPKGGSTIAVQLDHRIGMAFLTLGTACENPVTIDDKSAIATSFPGFSAVMNTLGAALE